LPTVWSKIYMKFQSCKHNNQENILIYCVGKFTQTNYYQCLRLETGHKRDISSAP
jgi:hypothetical protein